MKQRFLICDKADPVVVKILISEAFPELCGEEVLILDSIDAQQNVPYADFSFCTLWTTAYVLLKVHNTGLKFYFIQDYEPMFYPAGSTSAQVEETYRFGFYGIANTLNLCRLYQEKFHGIATHFTPQVDRDVFHPPLVDSRGQKATKSIVFYGRPGHPRNGFEMAIVALRLVKERLRDKVRIISVGGGFHAENYGLAGIIENLGVLSYPATGDLYRECDIGFVLMMTHHPSYLPFELMSCGALLVTNRNQANSWLLEDRGNCLLSPVSASGLADTLQYAVEGYDELHEVRSRAMDLMAMQHGSWDAQMEQVLSFVLSFSRRDEGSLHQS